jgi:hypothetical protein
MFAKDTTSVRITHRSPRTVKAPQTPMACPNKCITGCCDQIRVGERRGNSIETESPGVGLAQFLPRGHSNWRRAIRRRLPCREPLESRTGGHRAHCRRPRGRRRHAPAGALIDAVRQKRVLLTLGVVLLMTSALLLALYPAFPAVMAAQILLGAIGAILAPAVAAITLGVVGPASQVPHSIITVTPTARRS